MEKIIAGAQAPDFTVTSDAGKAVSLHDFLGKKVILYFYPKDNTAGCTLEAQQLDAAYAKLVQAGYEILGVSRNTVRQHVNFKKKFALHFTLLSDTDESLCKCYDVLREKKLYGRSYIGIDRSTFIIDETGRVTAVYRGVNAKEHVGKLLTDLGIE